MLTKNDLLITAIRDSIATSQRIVVASHIRPDGDAVGSLLGLGHALRLAGKQVQLVLADGVPENFHHLSGWDSVQPIIQDRVDLIIAVDASDVERLGKILVGYGEVNINIDHHATNTFFAQLNLVDQHAASTTEVIATYLPHFGLSMNDAVADSLLTGLITDTIGFRTQSTSPRTMRIAADLMEVGACLASNYYPALIQRSYEAARYWGSALARLQRQDRLIWTYLSLEDRRISGYSANDDADLINVLSAIEDVDIAMILVEQSPSRVKISWRLCGQSIHNVDVSQIASRFGGGGHHAAAGAEVDGVLMDVLTRSLAITKDYLTDHIMPPVKVG